MTGRDDTLEATAMGAWLEVSDALLRGVGHALNNRLAAVSSLARLAELEEFDREMIRAMLDDETHRLEEILRLFRFLPRAASRRPEPIRIMDLLPPVASLLHLHLHDVPVRIVGGDDVLPVWMEEIRLVHALLTLAMQVGESAGGVEIAVSGSDTEVCVRLGGPGAEIRTETADSVAEMLQGTGAVVHPCPAETVYEIRLVSLPEFRRRERAG